MGRGCGTADHDVGRGHHGGRAAAGHGRAGRLPRRPADLHQLRGAVRGRRRVPHPPAARSAVRLAAIRRGVVRRGRLGDLRAGVCGGQSRGKPAAGPPRLRHSGGQHPAARRAGPGQREVPVRAAELASRPAAGGRADRRDRARAGRGRARRLQAQARPAGLDGGAGREPAHRRDGARPVRRRPVRGRAGRGAARPDRRARRAAARLEGNRYRALPAALGAPTASCSRWPCSRWRSTRCCRRWSTCSTACFS